MPSQGRLRRGRTRSKTRALRAARSKPMISEAEGGIGEETPAVESPQRGKSPKKQAIMAATPQPSRKEFLGGLTRQTQKWSQNRFRMVLLTLFILMVLCYYMSPGFVNSVSPNEYLWSNEGPRGESVEEPSTWVSALHFFFPTTCIPKENQELKACNDRRDLKESECLEYKCCYSSLRTSNFSCFAPLKDRPLQMFRILGFSGVSMMILACLPIFCFSLCRRSKWANPLRRKANRMLKGLKKQKNKLKKDAQLLETAAEDEEELSDKKKQETKALLPR
ncbi:fragile X mental retardation 1 neighbor protein isoform X1 [Rousettus aegyptiacus]|uniref:FMR1 neighbor n=1 Tax=Rousettus aegyptiacus TaxID=9407 RepID=A0A7J8EJ91_ROUAE|nr:fragile X mental retardation 1 neighbor protein isoform X1 [Rousettus aegyptiacus]KAF6435416.1 FMR1 neighbor [Rousettus aegyptiacus]